MGLITNLDFAEHPHDQIIYNGVYDSYACRACNSWLEDKCTSDACSYCRGRPERPFD